MGESEQMKKKVLTIALAVALVAIMLTGASLAFFTDTTETKENVFTVGNVEITLTEDSWEASGSVDAPEVYPGERLAKDPVVTNDGANPCFVRIKVTGLDCLAPAGMSKYRTDWIDDKLGDDWVKGTDGNFYYTKILAPGESTDALFDQIVIPTDLTNGDAETEFSVVVVAEAVQAQDALGKNWSGVQAMTAAEIETWMTQVLG